MSNTILTPSAVTRAIAAVLHQKGKFISRVNKQYDAQSPEGRKAGGSIKIRMPNEYTVRRTATMVAQDTSETSETLTIGQLFGVDLNFTDTDLALSIEDFTQRFIDPAVSVLVSSIEAYFIQDAANSVANMIDGNGSAITFKMVMQARQKLIENLAPDDDGDLSLFMTPTHNTTLVDSLKTLYVPSAQIGEQLKSGSLGRVAGVGWVDVSTHLTDLLTGTSAEGDTTYNVNSATAGSTGVVTVDSTASTTFKAGEVLEFAGCNAVHPETKADLGYLKQFVVTSDYSGGAGDVAVSTGIGGNTKVVTSGARQNVSAYPTNTGQVYKRGAGNGEKLNRTLYFNRNFYAVAFADLENPAKYGAWGSREVVDGISVRMWRQGDITNGTFPCRIDVLCGGKAIRPQLACRIHADG